MIPSPSLHHAEPAVSAPTHTLMSGSEIFVRSLIAEGVEVLFGYPGGAVIGIYDALKDFSNIRHILTRHEQGATHAAEGYAKATGKTGVVLVTSGPGATNTVTGIADAFMDSIPIVVFSGQVPLKVIGNDAFQEADIVGITRPITKHNYLVRDVRDIARTVREAFYVARSGRPGPVLVDLPKDVMAQRAAFSYPDRVELPTYRPVIDAEESSLFRAADLIRSCRKPVLYVGGGVIHAEASPELRQFAERLSAPVTTTLHGLGAFPESHPLALGMLGMHGTWYSNIAVNECDLLVAVGARFDDRVTGKVDAFAPNSRKIHIDIDPSVIGKNVKVDVSLIGDVKRVLGQLLELVHPRESMEWLEVVSRWKEEHPLRFTNRESLRAQHVIQTLGEVTRGEAVVVTDVGQHQMWVAQFMTWMHPRTHLTSGGLGTMGFSLPAAMGAAFAGRNLPVISISGDGGFQMNSQEMATIVEHRLPVRIFIINNGYLGMVRQWQELFYKGRYSHVELYNPDFIKLSEAYGCPARRVTTNAEVEEAIRWALETTDGPSFVEFKVEKEDNVFPMLPSGQTIKELLDNPEPMSGVNGTSVSIHHKGR